MTCLSIGHHRYYQPSFSERISDISKSLLVRMIAISMVIITIFVYHRFYPLCSRSLFMVKGLAIVTLVSMAYYWKVLLFESILTINLILNFFFQWGWWNQIDEHIYLGAIPLERFNHEQILKQQLGIKAVVSIVEPFECEVTTLFGRSVSNSSWNNHLLLSSPDFSVPTRETLMRGVQWLQEQVNAGNNVYIHCKSGVGRSPTLLIVYYVKALKMGLNAARQKVADKRPAIFSAQSHNMCKLQEYLHMCCDHM